jgi:hypothetical protein
MNSRHFRIAFVPVLGAEPQDIELAIVSQRVQGFCITCRLLANQVPGYSSALSTVERGTFAPFEVEDECVLIWCLHQQVGRFLALKDASPAARRHTSATSTP